MKSTKTQTFPAHTIQPMTMSIPQPLQQIDRTYVRYQNQRLSYFAGCDYFRLASHPAVLRAAAKALVDYGLNVSASRMTTGNHVVYGDLENALAKFFAVETATLASNGYLPNLMVAQALTGQFSHVMLDERAHGCLADAAQLMGVPILRFKHRDATSLADLLKKLGNSKPLVMTDGMFSHDGGIAPLTDYLTVLPANGRLLVDDAHGAGVLGKNGRGTAEHWNLKDERIIQTMTLSKGFGTYGGAVLGCAELRGAILAKSRIFTGNTPLPLPLAAASIKAIGLLQTQKSWRTRLQKNIAFVKSKLPSTKLIPGAETSPIIPIIPHNAVSASQLKQKLLKAGIFPPFIQYPGGPPDGYFRFAISSEHSPTQLAALIAVLGDENNFSVK